MFTFLGLCIAKNNFLNYIVVINIRSISQACRLNTKSVTEVTNDNSPYKSIAKAISKICQCSTNEANTIIDKNVKLKKFAASDLQRRALQLQKLDINHSSIQEFPWLLTYSSNVIKARLKLLMKLKLEPVAVIPLSIFSVEKLFKLLSYCTDDMKTYPHQHRIIYLSQELQTTPSNMCKLFNKYQFIHTISFEKIKAVLDVLLKHGMSPENIMRDFWILMYNPQDIDTQLKLVKVADVEKIKPWMGRCERVKVERLIERLSTSSTLLGNDSIKEYIQHRLQCTPEQVQFIINRNPNILKMNVTKMKAMLDFLIYNEFTMDQIILGLPRIARRSVKTVNLRLTELRQLGHKPSSLYVLCKSKKEFNDFVNKWWAATE